MTSIWVGRHTKKEGDPKLCRASVYSREGGSYAWLHTYQCTRKPIVCRAIDGKEYGFCKQHDPESVKERGEARSEAMRAEWKAREERDRLAKQTRNAMDACKSAVEQIAAGHNDPRTLAVEVLALFPSPVASDQCGGGA